MERISKTYRFKKETVEQLEVLREKLEKQLGIKMSATSTIEYLINKETRNS